MHQIADLHTFLFEKKAWRRGEGRTELIAVPLSGAIHSTTTTEQCGPRPFVWLAARPGLWALSMTAVGIFFVLFVGKGSAVGCILHMILRSARDGRAAHASHVECFNPSTLQRRCVSRAPGEEGIPDLFGTDYRS